MTVAEFRSLIRDEVQRALEPLEARANQAPAEWLDREEAAALLKLHPDTLRRMTELPHHRIGRKLRYSRRDIETYLRKSA
jgi:excisionase family DNA binding protein